MLSWVILTVIVCVAIQFGVKPSYEASSVLRVDPSSQELFGNNLSSNPSAHPNYLETQVQLITSTNVLMAATSDPRATALGEIRRAPDPEVLIREMLTVTILPKSFLIRVATISKSPNEAADLVNAVVNSYLAADSEWSDGLTRNQIRNLEIYRQSLQTQLDQKQKSWLELAARGNAAIPSGPGARHEGIIPAVATKMSVSIEEYQRVRSQFLNAQLELAEAEAEKSFRQSHVDGANSGRPIDLERQIQIAFRHDPNVAKLLDELQTLDTKLARQQGLSRNRDDPAIRATQEKIKSLKGRYLELWEAMSAELRDRFAQTPVAPAAALQKVVERVAMLRASVATLKTTLDGLEVADRERSTDSVKSILVQWDLNRLQEMQGQVDRRLEQLRFDAQGQTRVKRISEAYVPTRAFSDKRSKLLLGAPFGVLAIIVGMTMLLDVRDRRVGGPDELSRKMSVETFAIPPLPASAPSRSLARTRPQEHLLAEYVHRIDHIREALCGGIFDRGIGRCVLVTSAVSGEGKSTLASQLAVRCSNAGATTLLIDADLRRPSLGKLLAVPDGPGLADVLKNESTLEDALVYIPLIDFTFLPAGNPEANPARVLLGSRLGPMLEQLRRKYDVVIIDTPPVLPVPDALTLGRYSDGAILASRFDSSRLRLVERAHNLLLTTGIPVLGAVVNGVESVKLFGGAYTPYISSVPSSNPDTV